MDQGTFQTLFVDLDYHYFGHRLVPAGWYAELRDTRRGSKVVKNAWGDRREIRIEEDRILGGMDAEVGVILVDPHLNHRDSDLEIRLTLLHEMVHADLWLQYPNDDEEHGPRFVHELRRLALACKADAKWPLLDRRVATALRKEALRYEAEACATRAV